MIRRLQLQRMATAAGGRKPGGRGRARVGGRGYRQGRRPLEPFRGERRWGGFWLLAGSSGDDAAWSDAPMPELRKGGKAGVLAHRFRLSKRAGFTSFCSTSTEQLSRSPVIKRRRLVDLAKDNPPIKKAIGCVPCHAQPLQSPSPPL